MCNFNRLTSTFNMCQLSRDAYGTWSNTVRILLGCWQWWRQWRRRTQTVCCSCPSHTSCGSRSLSWSICSWPRTAPGCKRQLLRILGLLGAKNRRKNAVNNLGGNTVCVYHQLPSYTGNGQTVAGVHSC